MFNINQFLQRMGAVRNSDAAKRTVIVAAIKSKIGLEVSANDLKIKPPRITVNGISQAARMELFLKKSALLAEINSALGSNLFSEIS